MTDICRTATYRALVTCLIRHLRAKREGVLGRIEADGWRWDSALSNELSQVDAALTSIGAHDTKFTRPT